MSDFTAQQQAVLDHKYKAMELSRQTGDHLDGKASTLLQSGAFIIALVGAVKIPVYVYAPDTLATIGIILAFLAFAGMIILALLAWQPSDISLPAPIDWDFLFEKYVYESPEQCFIQLLADINDTTEGSLARNALKARYVTWSTWLFGLQITGVLILALTA